MTSSKSPKPISISEIAWKAAKKQGWQPVEARRGDQVYIAYDTKKALERKRKLDPVQADPTVLAEARATARTLVTRDRKNWWQKHVDKVVNAATSYPPRAG